MREYDFREKVDCLRKLVMGGEERALASCKGNEVFSVIRIASIQLSRCCNKLRQRWSIGNPPGLPRLRLRDPRQIRSGQRICVAWSAGIRKVDERRSVGCELC